MEQKIMGVSFNLLNQKFNSHVNALKDMAEQIRNLPSSTAANVAQEERNSKMFLKNQIDTFN